MKIAVRFFSRPAGADVYAIPRFKWDIAKDKSLVLFDRYLVPEGKTRTHGQPPLETLLEGGMVYRIVFMCEGKGRIDRIIRPASTSLVEVSF